MASGGLLQYNTLYPAQVKAMEERATKLGKPKYFYYMSPNNANWLNASQSEEVELLGLGDHVVSDMHVGAGGGVEKATELFTKFPDMTMGAVNAETNDGSHTMTRAAKEAEDLNKWFNGAHSHSVPLYTILVIWSASARCAVCGLSLQRLIATVRHVVCMCSWGNSGGQTSQIPHSKLLQRALRPL